MLILSVSMLTVGTRFTVSPAQTGVALSYILSIQQVGITASVILPCTQPVSLQAFSFVVRQLAEVENDMNSVERIVYYTHDLEQEPPHNIPEKQPAAPWPSEGKLEINDAVLKYRPELPTVLKGLSMTVEGGEKIGIVGRWVAFLTTSFAIKLMSSLLLVERVPANHL
jgi:ABC-type multidrug transport system fused ATPase/permease subunit